MSGDVRIERFTTTALTEGGEVTTAYSDNPDLAIELKQGGNEITRHSALVLVKLNVDGEPLTEVQVDHRTLLDTVEALGQARAAIDRVMRRMDAMYAATESGHVRRDA